MPTYKGFSTVGNRKKSRLTDFQLVKQDLINHFHIRKGEKLHNPTFGTLIWDYLFEPLTDEVKRQIEDDVRTIISYDPRVNATDIFLSSYEHGVTIQIDLVFIDTDQTDTLKLNFDSETKSLGVL